MSWRTGSLTIPNGGTDSEILNLVEFSFPGKKTVTLYAPATLTGTVKVYIAPHIGGTFVAMNDGFGNDAVVPVAKGVTRDILAGALKLVSSGAEGGARIFLYDYWEDRS